MSGNPTYQDLAAWYKRGWHLAYPTRFQRLHNLIRPEHRARLQAHGFLPVGTRRRSEDRPLQPHEYYFEVSRRRMTSDSVWPRAT